MSRSSVLALVALSTLGAPGQARSQDFPVPPHPQAGGSTELLPGKLAGTFRYNVTFAHRPFDLDEFRMAIEAGATAEAMDRIVADLQVRAREHQEPFRLAIVALGGRVDPDRQFWLINACTIEIKPADVAAVAKMANVLFVHPDRAVFTSILTSSNANNHNSDFVQNSLNIRATGFSVAVCDTGQDSNMGGTGRPHRIYYRNGNPADTTGGGLNGSRLRANIQIGAQPADDIHGHGTGVGGIAAGEVWGGASADRGHASDAGIVGLAICDVNDPGCGSSTSTQAAAWQQMAAQKVRYNIVVGNMSYGSAPDPLEVSQQAIDSTALTANVIPVCAAGNSGASTQFSASVANGLAVAACSPNSKSIAGFSSRGPLFGDAARFYPDITACGVGTIMPVRNAEASSMSGDGTSMASPQVAGAAALVKAARPASSAREIKAILLASSQDIASQNPGLNRNAYGMGFSRDDLAVNLARTAGKVLSSTHNSTVTPKTHLIAVTTGLNYVVALTWFRHNTFNTNWSNLNLRILNGATVVASSATTRNLYEMVRFTAPITGNLTVEVAAASLEVNPLPYALATTAAFTGLVAGNYAFDGAGCVGTAGIPSLFPSANPVLGQSMAINLAFARPSSAGVLLLGGSNLSWNGIPLPFDLAAAGAPGCFLRVSAEVLLVAPTNATGTGTVNLGIPNDVSLLNSTFFNQFLVYDPPINALDFVVSNSGKGTIGQF